MVEHNTLIYLDWDDTLFPTTWYNTNRITDLHIQKFDMNVHDFLLQLQKHGDIIVVTNAAISWVLEAKKILENTNKILEKINIVSARDKYSKYSDNPVEWKRMAFEDCINDYGKDNISNIMSIGDSDQEREAIMTLRYPMYNNVNIKSVKLVSGAYIETMSEQYEILIELLGFICCIDVDIDIDMKSYMKKYNTKKLS